MSPLKERLESIRLDSERRQSWVVHIYGLIDSNFREYCTAFWIDPADEEKAKEELYDQLMKTIRRLKEDHTRAVWMTALIRKIWEKWTSPEYKLGWIEFRCTMDEGGRSEKARLEILSSKGSGVKKGVIRALFWKEPGKTVDDQEIGNYISQRSWPHVSRLTQSWKDFINWYLNAIGSDDVDAIKERIKENCKGLLS
ncbi:MAG: hypothetical protein ACD_2C00136G0004 [uncultured bacterium (gcode 4)]|uniref:Uncharacterized protein n=1 Tax=uncultured bacterium (gcode 4) TaxID=1234023 RepID=K2G349_9BACT|nr:MAG: hypothetical protein ACD_2C00136G0004 [uncultured bacterium (gcode 4)]